MSLNQELKEVGFTTQYLLNVNKNVKTKKNTKYGYLTGILYLAPHTIGGTENVCPASTIACQRDCLYYSGMARQYSVINQARINRKKLFFEHRDLFIRKLIVEIEALRIKAKELGLKPLVRLNGTSDINWSSIIINLIASMHCESEKPVNIFQAFPEVKFYDYTKVYDYAVYNNRTNYNITLSYTGFNKKDCIEYLGFNGSVSVIFRKNIPAMLWGYPVIDGDKHDIRIFDKACIVGLKFKKNNLPYQSSEFIIEE